MNDSDKVLIKIFAGETTPQYLSWSEVARILMDSISNGEGLDIFQALLYFKSRGGYNHFIDDEYSNPNVIINFFFDQAERFLANRFDKNLDIYALSMLDTGISLLLSLDLQFPELVEDHTIKRMITLTETNSYLLSEMKGKRFMEKPTSEI